MWALLFLLGVRSVGLPFAFTGVGYILSHYLIDVFPFQFGEKQNIRLVRFLNSTVMVRVGGGWVTLDEFLETNDPCRGISEDIYPTFYFILFLFLYLDTNSTRVHCLYI